MPSAMRPKSPKSGTRYSEATAKRCEGFPHIAARTVRTLSADTAGVAK
jgi:hypothetical protein